VKNQRNHRSSRGGRRHLNNLANGISSGARNGGDKLARRVKRSQRSRMAAAKINA